MILLIDNYDSFTYNLEQYLGELDRRVTVVRNDEISPEEVPEIDPDAVVISPGPGRPPDAGVSCEVLRRYGNDIPFLGVCLGHQCIGHIHGADITSYSQPVHGKSSAVHHDGNGVFADLDNPLRAARYHSLVLDGDLPAELAVSARTEDGSIMGVRHRTRPVTGIQFHPESILTNQGKKLLDNFLRWADRFDARKAKSKSGQNQKAVSPACSNV